jgi:hypothetical protein
VPQMICHNERTLIVTWGACEGEDKDGGIPEEILIRKR